MAKLFYSGGKKAIGAISALLATMLLITSCGTEKPDNYSENPKDEVDNPLPPQPGPLGPDVPGPGLLDPGLGGGPIPVEAWDVIALMVRTDPAHPQNENFLDDWRFQLFNIDDQSRPTTPTFHGESGPDGTTIIGLPAYMFARPLVITAYNDSYPLIYVSDDEDDELPFDTIGECIHFEIFVPPFCYDKSVWLLGPFENALWRHYYKRASRHRGEAWNPSQVDCATWLANLQLLIMTDRVTNELQNFASETTPGGLYYPQFHREAMYKAIRENQQFLTPTRPPICMAERRHNGGGMERDGVITGDSVDLDNFVPPFEEISVNPDEDPVIIDLATGIVSPTGFCPTYVVDEVGTLWSSAIFQVNGAVFTPTNNYYLRDDSFMGSVSDQTNTVSNVDVSVWNAREGNGYQLDYDPYDDACALTWIAQFTNTGDDEQDLHNNITGTTFFDLFGDGDNTTVFLTSSGDNVVTYVDTWAIFYRDTDPEDERLVLAVELLGIRQEDFRDELEMVFDTTSENLFLGLRADYELNEEQIDGEEAFFVYTLSVWDGSTFAGRNAVRRNIADCYEASDIWAREFFITQDFEERRHKCCTTHEHCHLEHLITSIEAAEFAVRSQCFSNSRANQRWRTADSGIWSINADHGVESNIIVNPGWLGPHMDYQIFIQRFDEPVFKGPRTIVHSDSVGQIIVDMPTLVEGDRVLIKADESCCDDYDLVLPCVPEFTGFAGAPGIPYIPITLGPPPLPPVVDPIGAGIGPSPIPVGP